MPKKNKLSRFVSELQRRNVYKVVAMYAASAYIILQLVDILTPALSLPLTLSQRQQRENEGSLRLEVLPPCSDKKQSLRDNTNFFRFLSFAKLVEL